MEIQTSARQLAIAISLEWQNSFITVEGFAEHHQMTPEQASRLIAICNEIFNSKHPEQL